MFWVCSQTLTFLARIPRVDSSQNSCMINGLRSEGRRHIACNVRPPFVDYNCLLPNGPHEGGFGLPFLWPINHVIPQKVTLAFVPRTRHHGNHVDDKVPTKFYNVLRKRNPSTNANGLGPIYEWLFTIEKCDFF